MKRVYSHGADPVWDRNDSKTESDVLHVEISNRTGTY